MNIEEFLLTLELPKKYYDSNFDITDKFAEEAKNFIDGIKNVSSADFIGNAKRNKVNEMLGNLQNDAEKTVNRISNIFNFYEKADLKQAQEEFDEMMEFILPDLFLATIDDWNEINTPDGKIKTQFRITSGHHFFRVRGVERKREDIESNPDELFHIPLTKKALVNNERFSLAGFPSLYLASMLPLAWQESGYPQRYYYSEYQYLKMDAVENRNFSEELKFLSLYSPQEIYAWGKAMKHNQFDLWLNVVYRYLRMYPLVMACSFVNQSGKGPYKQEYIIPQMLMQWVQRNIDFIQGISYFTCVDIKMMPGAYCAYNVVIPALEPYDAKKYSQKLRDEFTWTKPCYFEIPLLDSCANNRDRRIIYDYIVRIRSFHNYWLPTIIENYVDEIERICVCLYSLMIRGNNADVQMIIHTLDLINVCYNKIQSLSVTKILEKGKKEKSFISDEAYKDISKEFKVIVDSFINKDTTSNSVAIIIDKYRNTLWNNSYLETIIDITYRSKDDITELEKWLHDNHLIYSKHLIKEDAGSSEKEIDDCDTPIVKRFNSVNIYNPDGPKFCDYEQEGFDIATNGKDLIKNV